MALDFPASGLSLWAIADATGVRPEWLLPLMFVESAGYQVGIQNQGGADYWGLIQCSGAWLKKHGIDPASLKTGLASQELDRVVSPFVSGLVQALGPLRSGIRAYQAVFLPGSVKKGSGWPHYAPGLTDVMTQSPESAYTANKGFDAEGKGWITPGDLGATLIRNSLPAQAYKDALAQTYALRPGETPKDAIYGTDFAPGAPLSPGAEGKLANWAALFTILGSAAGIVALLRAEGLPRAADSSRARAA